MKRMYLGVDPGMYGAIAAIKGDTRDVTVLPFPLAGKEINADAIVGWITSLVNANRDYDFTGCIEQTFAMHGMAASGAHNFGVSVGLMHGIFAAFRIPRNMVRPQVWQKRVLGKATKDKNDAIAYCQRVYPEVPLIIAGSKKPNNGMSDAICIATYAVLENL